jgi:hypothetical protein
MPITDFMKIWQPVQSLIRGSHAGSFFTVCGTSTSCPSPSLWVKSRNLSTPV